MIALLVHLQPSKGYSNSLIEATAPFVGWKFFHPPGAKPGICAVKVIYKVVRNFKRLPAIPRVPVFPL